MYNIQNKHKLQFTVQVIVDNIINIKNDQFTDNKFP